MRKQEPREFSPAVFLVLLVSDTMRYTRFRRKKLEVHKSRHWGQTVRPAKGI